MTDILLVLTTPRGVAALLQVVMIDLVLAGDNAIVIDASRPNAQNRATCRPDEATAFQQ